MLRALRNPPWLEMTLVAFLPEAGFDMSQGGAVRETAQTVREAS
jgi:hypothetical protein